MRPSGLNATPQTEARVSAQGPDVSARGGVPELHGVVRAGRGEGRPSGLNATPQTCRSCPRRSRTSWPVAASQSLIVSVLSWRRRGCGRRAEYATPRTPRRMSAQRHDLLAGRRRPRARVTVHPGRRRCVRPSGLNTPRPGHWTVPAQGPDLLPGGRVPELHGAVLAGRGDPAAVGADTPRPWIVPCPRRVRRSARRGARDNTTRSRGDPGPRAAAAHVASGRYRSMRSDHGPLPMTAGPVSSPPGTAPATHSVASRPWRRLRPSWSVRWLSADWPAGRWPPQGGFLEASRSPRLARRAK